MGPSGSGKTTLLNALTGRNLREYSFEGKVMINQQVAKFDMIKSISGYVQQGDLFVAMLTVKEYLVFMSLVRMERNTPAAERKRRINEVLDELELTKCSNSRIGNRDLGSFGISGGESRRLSFAAEMLTNPLLLFCDEPTSGLDSFLAENVVKILKKMSQSGRTIICTIHQPSSEVFILFNKLLLLSQGKVAFIGTPDAANTFFSSLGLVCPQNFNPADFYLKQLSVVPGFKKECLEMINKICAEFKNQQGDENEVIESTAKFKATSIHQAPWFEQFSALLWRSFISNLREPMIVRIKIVQTIVVALLLGLVFVSQNLDQKGIMNINGAIFSTIINLTFMNVFSCINTFSSELPLFFREYSNGMYRTDTYFLAKSLAELPFQLFMPTLFIAILYYMVI
ncbi:ABC transporter sub-family G-like protein 10 [Sarcoptes scabiei]|uniref:ABC transporter sub-family G-like protein 10 n=1 Tax=Sarcoptes scabiei TaxID=52283 RepID=A0A132A595_SARSC|nr:ABC transporter sub-family G-like protein 10 [Sarcoptes scabiei]